MQLLKLLQFSRIIHPFYIIFLWQAQDYLRWQIWNYKSYSAKWQWAFRT